MMTHPLIDGVTDNWTWNINDKSPRINVLTEDATTAIRWGGHCTIRGTRKLNGGLFYWEVQIHEQWRPCMVGIGTRKSPLETRDRGYLMGMTADSWGLSFIDRDETWDSGNRLRTVTVHNGKPTVYLNANVDFRENIILGLYFDGLSGTLSYYKDGKCLGVAFKGLHQVQEPLYPMVSSKSSGGTCGGVTKIILLERKKAWPTLQYLSRAVIANSLCSREDAQQLELPSKLKSFEAVSFAEPIEPCQTKDEPNPDDTEHNPQIYEPKIEKNSFRIKFTLRRKRKSIADKVKS